MQFFDHADMLPLSYLSPLFLLNLPTIDFHLLVSGSQVASVSVKLRLKWGKLTVINRMKVEE
jgi:hypothetical protein